MKSTSAMRVKIDLFSIIAQVKKNKEQNNRNSSKHVEDSNLQSAVNICIILYLLTTLDDVKHK